MVGEGANLAFTQRARIEYARRGGHVNTDAIDNAAGVDISDHEVNLKILLRPAVEAGEITATSATGSSARWPTTSWRGAARLRAPEHGPRPGRRRQPGPDGGHRGADGELEADGVVDRAVEALPDPGGDEAREDAGAGLTRPELAVLLAGAKRSLAARLLASDVPDQPALRAALVAYFPPALAERFDDLLDSHRLRRELVASEVANDLVDRMGATFVTRLVADTGASPAGGGRRLLDRPGRGGGGVVGRPGRPARTTRRRGAARRRPVIERSAGGANP